MYVLRLLLAVVYTVFTRVDGRGEPSPLWEQKTGAAKARWRALWNLGRFPEAKEETVERLLQTRDMSVKMLALGDKLSNIRAIYRDYLTIGDKLWERFNQNDKQQHGWYYSAIVEATSDLRQYPA